MKIRSIALCAALVVLPLAGCSAAPAAPSAPQTGSNRPPETPPAPSAPQTSSPRPTKTPSATTTPAPQPVAETTTTPPAVVAIARFGETVTFDNGLAIAVGQPVAFRPSASAAFHPAPGYLKIQVTIVNGTARIYDPNEYVGLMRSAHLEASSVFDYAADIGAPGSAKLSPGHQTTFLVGFGVKDPKDLAFEVRVGSDYGALLFTS